MAAAEVFLHIGPPKTGTTYLQSLLNVNQRRLRRAGVLVPGTGRAPHFEAAGDLRGRPRRGGRPAKSGAWDRLAAEVRTWPGASVISCEWLAFCDPPQVTRALGSFGSAEVNVVLTLRDLARVVPAVWQEQVKNGRDFTMTQFLDRVVGAGADKDDYAQWFWNVHDPRRLLPRWAAELPADRVHLVTLPKAGAPPDELWQRFSSLFVSDPGSYDTSTGRSNPGLDAADAEFLRRVNAELGSRMKKAAHAALVKDYLHDELTRQQGSGGAIRLPDPAVPVVAARAAEIVDALRTTGHHVVGSLDDLLVDGARPADTTLPEESDTEDVARAAVRSTAALLLTMQADGAHRRRVWRRTAGSGQRRGRGEPAAPDSSGGTRRRALGLVRRAGGRVRRAAAGG